MSRKDRTKTRKVPKGVLGKAGLPVKDRNTILEALTKDLPREEGIKLVMNLLFWKWMYSVRGQELPLRYLPKKP